MHEDETTFLLNSAHFFSIAVCDFHSIGFADTPMHEKIHRKQLSPNLLEEEQDELDTLSVRLFALLWRFCVGRCKRRWIH